MSTNEEGPTRRNAQLGNLSPARHIESMLASPSHPMASSAIAKAIKTFDIIDPEYQKLLVAERREE